MRFLLPASSVQYSPQYNNPNQYVNQGYQNVDFNRQQAFSPTPTRIIPIRVEGGAASPMMSPNYRGPTVQSPVIVQR